MPELAETDETEEPKDEYQIKPIAVTSAIEAKSVADTKDTLGSGDRATLVAGPGAIETEFREEVMQSEDPSGDRVVRESGGQVLPFSFVSEPQHEKWMLCSAQSTEGL